MASKVDKRLRDVGGDTVLGDAPHLDGGVLTGGGDDLVMERVEFEVKDRSRVSANHGKIRGELAGLIEGKDCERSSASLRYQMGGNVRE
jgi:hypothetical protein